MYQDAVFSHTLLLMLCGIFYYHKMFHQNTGFFFFFEGEKNKQINRIADHRVIEWIRTVKKSKKMIA